MDLNSSLPIDAIRQPLEEALGRHQQIIIHAPPGAGKSTRLPLWLLSDDRFAGQKILLIQPRRLAASNVAQFLARQLGDAVGGVIGLRTRYDHKISSQTRIEVMTEGLFIRLLQADPELAGVACVLFDEFHERSLQLDLGLALCLESQEVYRDDNQPLTVFIMSATLAAEQIQAVLNDACLLCSEGRCYPVETFYRPLATTHNKADAVGRYLLTLIEEESGSILVFLPGIQEIKRVAAVLGEASLADNIQVYSLHSSLDDCLQRAAIEPSASGVRKIVLATNVAETSVTIDGITVVVDLGLARVPSLDVKRGMPLLKTQQISKASADQRQGRAGRTAPGRCYRLWSQESHHSLYDYESPEIQRGDLSAFLLELAQWGEADVSALTFIDFPPAKSLQVARELLERLEAVDQCGLITARGRKMVNLGLHPRLGAMCIEGQHLACLSEVCLLATLLTEPKLLRHSRESDLMLTLEALGLSTEQKTSSALHRGAVNRVLKLSTQLVRRIDRRSRFSLAECRQFSHVAKLLLCAFPDRVAKRRNTKSDRYLLLNSQELRLHPEDRLNGQPWLLVMDSGTAKEAGGLAYIHKALAISEGDLAPLFDQSMTEHYRLEWRDDQSALVARKCKMLGAIVLSEQPFKPDAAQLLEAVLAYVREQGLACLDVSAYRELAARMAWLKLHAGVCLADYSEPALLLSLDEWLGPHLGRVRRQADLKAIDVKSILMGLLSWDDQQCLNRLAPSSMKLPTGQMRSIEYARLDRPVVSARIQEFYGLQSTPAINRGGYPLLVELLSPANRPLQLTNDLAGFWSNTYHEVAKEMRGRYPKHFWPENPAEAKATAKTKKWM